MRTKKQITVVEQDPEKWDGLEQDFYFLSLEVKDMIDSLQAENNRTITDIDFREIQGKMYGIIKWEYLIQEEQ